MPSDPTAEQLEIRHKGRQRLIGAVALALLAVVFLPMILDPEPRRERGEPILAIPPRDGAPPLPGVSGPPVTATISEPGKAELSESPAAPSASGPAPDAAAGSMQTEVRKTVEPKDPEFRRGSPKPPETKAAVARSESPAEPAAPKLEGYAVQVGAFKDEARLKQARARLASAGISHFIERQKDFTRLRAGPFPSRTSAEAALADVKRAGLDGRVVPLP